MLSFYKKKIVEWNWYDLPEVSSTNDIIKNLSDDFFPAVISAARQTKGRGRQGRSWQELTGNLYFTFSLNIKVHQLSQYVCLIGLSLVKTIKKLSPKIEAHIKWPNDIFVNEKKITGILLENIKDDLWAIGIGVNIVGSPTIKDKLYQATSLKENGIVIDRIKFLELYLKQFSQDLALYQQKGFSDIKSQWLNNALYIGQEITITNGSVSKKGTFFTLDDNGYLILKTSKGSERIIAGDLFNK